MNEEYKSKVYWDNVALQIMKRDNTAMVVAGDYEPFYIYKRNKFLNFFRTLNFKGLSVIEIGCGPGGNLGYISEQGAQKIIGFDISAKMLEIAKMRFQNLNNIFFATYEQDNKLPFSDCEFDFALTSTVLQHIVDDVEVEELINEICRVTKSDIYICERTEIKIKRSFSNVGRPVSFFKKQFENNGFKTESVKYLNVQISYFVCGIIRKFFGKKNRNEGENHSQIVIFLQKIVLIFTVPLDKLFTSKRDLTIIHFKK